MKRRGGKMAFKGIEQVNNEAEERGYYRSDMEDTKKRILDERREWKHHFQQFCHESTSHDIGMTPKLIIASCAELTDLMFAKISERFPEEIEDA